jgi:RNA polymerase sigma-70 factor (ECF subfamily)
VLRVDTGGADSNLVRGAVAVASQAARYRAPGLQARYALVNDGPGIVATIDGRLSAVLAFTVSDGRVIEVDILADPQRLSKLDIPR